MLYNNNNNVKTKIKPPTAMRIELASQKLPPNIIPLDNKSQLLCSLTIDQSILGRSNALITPLKYLIFGGFHQKKFARPKMRTRERKDRQQGLHGYPNVLKCS